MTPQALSPLHRLSALGQSVWVDYLSRDSIHGGHLQQLIDEHSVVGATSNPTIFEKAMTAGDAYDEQMRELAEQGADARASFWTLAQRDIVDACDLFMPLWEASGGRDGYASLEVDPGLAYDTLRTYREAMRIHDEVDRRNLMVKIPATEPGLAAVEDVISRGRSVNVTLIFSLSRYAAVAESYIRGVERLVAGGGDPSTVASVASFFVSRIDTEADARLEKLDADPSLRGKLAIANAKLAYERYEAVFSGPRWDELAAAGARPQRLLWASTSTKNPEYPETIYVDGLIGPDTVDTMPEETIVVYQDHGRPRPTLRDGLVQARALLGRLERAGVDYDEVTAVLEREGVEKFAKSFEDLLGGIGEKLGALAAV
ncbi:MAG: transaldolase [Solirubrobacteraceae bacterium]